MHLIEKGRCAATTGYASRWPKLTPVQGVFAGLMLLSAAASQRDA
jgi:hypothetical protein